jgi:hypothetical protein
MEIPADTSNLADHKIEITTLFRMLSRHFPTKTKFFQPMPLLQFSKSGIIRIPAPLGKTTAG